VPCSGKLNCHAEHSFSIYDVNEIRGSKEGETASNHAPSHQRV
jgi:hypothetical protein